MNDNQVFVALYVNKINTQIAISTDKENMTIVDMSYGYEKTFSTSIVLYDENDDEFIFFESMINSDIYDDSYFESIINIVNSDEEFITIKNKKFTKEYILSLFFKQCLNFVFEINSDFSIENICICFEELNDSDLITKSLINNNISEEKISFISKNEALYLDTIYNKKEEEDFTILFLDNFQSSELNLNKNSEEVYTETILIKENLNSQTIYNKIHNLFVDIFSKQTNIINPSFEESWNIDKLAYKSYELILNKFIEKADCKIFFNFCTPPFEAVIKHDNLKEFFENKFIEKYENKKIYIYSETIAPTIYKKLLFTNCEVLESSLILGILYKSCFNPNIKIYHAEEIIYDYGLMLKLNEKDIFFSILKNTDLYLSKPQAFYFYYRKNDNNHLTLYKRNNDSCIVVKELNLDKLNISTEFTRLKISTELSTNNVISITIENEGFLNSNQNLINSFDKVCYEINEV